MKGETGIICREHEGPTLFHPCSVPAGENRPRSVGCAISPATGAPWCKKAFKPSRQRAVDHKGVWGDVTDIQLFPKDSQCALHKNTPHEYAAYHFSCDIY